MSASNSGSSNQTVDVPPMKIIIDNTDEGIQYTGSNWTTVGPFADGYGVPVYNGSQSMAQGTGHEFAYNFGGTSIAVFGSWDYTDNPLPVCEVDGLVILGPASEHINARTRQMQDEADDFASKLLLATNQMPLCSTSGLDEIIPGQYVVRSGVKMSNPAYISSKGAIFTHWHRPPLSFLPHCLR